MVDNNVGPQPAAPSEPAPTVCSDGPFVWMRVWAKLPRRCVKCNKAADGPPIRHAFGDSAVGSNPHGEVGAIIYLLTRRTTTIHFYLCRRHRKERAIVIGAGGAVALLGMVAIAAVAVIGRPAREWDMVAACPLVAGLGVLVPYQMTYLKGSIIGGWLRFSGAGWPFLGSLPDPPVGIGEQR